MQPELAQNSKSLILNSPLSNSPLSNSPNRNSNVKRKIPDSFYKPPVLKTQLFSIEQRSIHHAHTNSLPVETPLQMTTPSLHSTSSFNNLYEAAYTTPTKQPQTAQPMMNNHFANSNPIGINNPVINKHLDQPQFGNQVGQHVKTYSLPVSFEPSTYVNNGNGYMSNSQVLPPPTRNFNNAIDIPLPPHWEAQKTANGQVYFINHMTKTTTWDDPRRLFNLPTNQNEISHDLRLTISKTIPLPHGWEEARNANGEVYFINHKTRTTCWEDPRLTIYMQQQQNINDQYNMNKMNPYAAGNYSNLPQSSSSSSLYSSSSSSLSSTSSSLQNLSSLPTQFDSYNPNFNAAGFNKFPTAGVNTAASNVPQIGNSKNDPGFIYNLRKNLDQVIDQKKQICSQLDELSKQEMLLKSKLSQQDLDELLRRLKTTDSSMSSFTQYDRSVNLPVVNKMEPSTDSALPTNAANVTKTVSSNPSSETTQPTLNKSLNNDVDLDSTLVIADPNSSANNLNTSAS